MIGSKEVDEYYKSAFETCRKEVEETLAVSHNDIVGKTYDRLLQKGYSSERVIDAISEIYASFRTEAFMFGRTFSIEDNLNRL